MPSPPPMASPLLASSTGQSSPTPIDPALMKIPLIRLTKAEESVLSAQQKARDNMADRYSKRYAIEIFTPDMIVTVRIPREDQGTLVHARLYARVLNQPYQGRYRLQTEHGILDHLYPTRELNCVDNPTLVGMYIFLF